MAGAGSAQNESRVAQIPAVWRYFGPAPPSPWRSSCSAATEPRPQEARRALFFLRPNLGIEVGGSRGATEDNLKPKENADAKMSHSNLSPSRFEFVACTGRRLKKLNTKVSES